MMDLRKAVEEQGYDVVHIKTDSIKVPGATQELTDFIFEFGRKYGYDFEKEAVFEDFVLFNDAVYIAKYAEPEKKRGQWDAVGAQFQHPYVYKTLLSNEEIVFDDLCESKNVAKGNIYVVNDDKHFVGRVGRFTPVVEGVGGGALMRVHEGKEYAVTGTKGYLWMESSKVDQDRLDEIVDYSYFENLMNKAQDSMNSVGYVLA